LAQQSKGRRIAAWILTGLITLVFAASAVAKLTKAGTNLENFYDFIITENALLHQNLPQPWAARLTLDFHRCLKLGFVYFSVMDEHLAEVFGGIFQLF